MPELGEPPFEGGERHRTRRPRRGDVGQYADPMRPVRRLRFGSARRGKQTESAEEGAAPHYSITWSARWSNDGGMVRPRALAVFRLMTSSNFVGCSIGMSAGLAPLRILST